MADTLRIPDKAYGHVPTPTLAVPIELTLRADLDVDLTGHVEHAVAQIERHGAECCARPWLSGGPRPDAPG